MSSVSTTTAQRRMVATSIPLTQVWKWHPITDQTTCTSTRVGAKTERRANGWQMYTFTDIRRQLGHVNTRIQVVKMDIEHSEWGVIPEMFQSGEMNRIKQLLIEWHFAVPINLEKLRIIQRLSAEVRWKMHLLLYCWPLLLLPLNIFVLLVLSSLMHYYPSLIIHFSFQNDGKILKR